MGLLRTLLALSVVLAHSPWHDGFVFVGGRNAVQIFYMISGFLMSHILATTGKYQDVSRFYISRCLRLFPLYYLVAFGALGAAVLHDRAVLHIYLDAPWPAALALAVTNLTLIGQDMIMFTGVKAGHFGFMTDFRQSDIPLYRGLLAPQAWTLSLELMFYAMAPFVLRRRQLMLGLLALSVLVRVVLFQQGVGTLDPWSYRFFPAELALFLLGAFSNQLILPLWQKHLADQAPSILPGAATLFLALASVTYFIVPIADGIKMVGLFGAFWVLLPLAFIYQNAVPRDRLMGEISYPLYISHLLVIGVIAPVVGRYTHYTAWMISLVNALCTLGFAAMLYLVVGRRLEHIRADLVVGKNFLPAWRQLWPNAKEADS